MRKGSGVKKAICLTTPDSFDLHSPSGREGRGEGGPRENQAAASLTRPRA